jgi:hypothetical protein
MEEGDTMRSTAVRDDIERGEGLIAEGLAMLRSRMSGTEAWSRATAALSNAMLAEVVTGTDSRPAPRVGWTDVTTGDLDVN